MSIHVPQNYIFREICPYKLEMYQRIPQKHILAWKDVTQRIDRQKWLTDVTCVHG